MLSWPPTTMIDGVAVADRLPAEGDGAQARAAELVDAERGLLDRNAGIDRGLAGRVLALAGAQDLAQDDFVDFLGFTLARSSAPLIATLPRSWAGTAPNAPLNEPIGVRAALAMTMSMCHGNPPCVPP